MMCVCGFFPEVFMDVLVRGFILERFGMEVLEGTLLSEVVQDSVSRVEMLFELEGLAGVRLSESEVLDLETVGDLVRAFGGRARPA
jgi:acyl carrier protein